jgi:hypothetical protein
MLRIKNFSWASFFIGAGGGFVVGALLLGVLVNYLISNAISGASTEGIFLGSSVDQVREGIAKVNAEKAATSVYGHVVSIDVRKGIMVLEVAQIEGKKQYTFEYDSNTQFVYLANDAASTETPFSPETIPVGDGLNVHVNEAVGSVPNQHAVKVIRI